MTLPVVGPQHLNLLRFNPTVSFSSVGMSHGGLEEFPLSVTLVIQTAFLYITCVLGLVPRS